MRKLNIALVAHDARKQELVDWVRFNGKTLYPHYPHYPQGILWINSAISF